MKNCIAFAALGGGQEVGASSYFMSIGGKYFLFDCGRGTCDKLIYGPDFTTVLDPLFLSSLSQIDSVFVSHGHFDHIGYLPDFLGQCTDVPVFSTAPTKEFGVYLMSESVLKEQSERSRMNYESQCIRAFRCINTVNYNETMKFDGYSVTFFQAGHIPGAAMVYVETDAGNILYTGDFSVKSTPLTDGCIIPRQINPDTIILCGVHAKHPFYSTGTEKIISSLNSVKYQLARANPVYLTVKQLTKGIEILHIIFRLTEQGKFPEVCVYVDDKLWELSERFAYAGISALNRSCYRFPRNFRNPEFGLYLGFGRESCNFSYRRYMDFSLHADYEDIKQFIGRYRPKNIILVHSPDDIYATDKYALSKEFPDINFIYAENGEIYLL